MVWDSASPQPLSATKYSRNIDYHKFRRSMIKKGFAALKSLAPFVTSILGMFLTVAANVFAASIPPEPGYQIGPEDVLEISVWKEEGLRKEVLVRPDGGISFPLVGELSVLGKTPGQLEAEIKEKLDRFIPQPAVSVAVLKVTGNKIYVIGKVQRPGEFVAGRYVDVLQALSMAGGLTPFAAENKIKILRKEEGKDIVLPFEYSKVRNGERLEQNVMLKSGDVVVVP